MGVDIDHYRISNLRSVVRTGRLPVPPVATTSILRPQMWSCSLEMSRAHEARSCRVTCVLPFPAHWATSREPLALAVLFPLQNFERIKRIFEGLVLSCGEAG